MLHIFKAWSKIIWKNWDFLFEKANQAPILCILKLIKTTTKSGKHHYAYKIYLDPVPASKLKL